MESDGFAYVARDGDPLLDAARAGRPIDLEVLSLAIRYRDGEISLLRLEVGVLQQQKERMLQDAKLKRHPGAR